MRKKLKSVAGTTATKPVLNSLPVENTTFKNKIGKSKKNGKVPANRKASTNRKSPGLYNLELGYSEELDSRELLTVLSEVKDGNFAVRLPDDKIGLSGEICDTLNQIISLNEILMDELTQARNTIGKKGHLNHRVSLPRHAKGSWASGVDSINTLISDLVHPTIEIAHVISSVAKGNLSQEMPLKIGDHVLQGEFAKIATEVNDMVTANRSLQKQIEERKISEDKIQQLNQQLTENNTHLKQVNEELDQFAYMASHDLQEPLRKIQMFSDKILLKKEQDGESEKYFSKIISASRRMQSLINNLLDFSRHSFSSSDFKVTDLNQLVKETLTDLEIDIEKSTAQINYSNLPVISVVPGLMQRLFYNLLSNAIKFRKKDVSPVIDIKAEKMQPAEVLKFIGQTNGSLYYKITVSDNGIGFDNKHSGDIFKVFKRLHSYQEFEGTGVGLAICKKIVEKHGGFISAESIVDLGSSFILCLPERQLKN